VELDNNFTVTAPIDQAWDVLLDVEKVARCLPGATLEGSEDGNVYAGHVKLKVGPIVVTYKGTAQFLEIDADHHRAVIDASGKEARGSGTAKAVVTTELRDGGDHTEVFVKTELNITGRPAQFGRSVIADVAARLTDQFAKNLAAELEAPAPPPAAETTPPEESEGGAATNGSGGGAVATATSNGGPPQTASAPPPDDDVIDVLGVSAGPILKRLAPLALLAGLLVLALVLRRRRA